LRVATCIVPKVELGTFAHFAARDRLTDVVLQLGSRESYENWLAFGRDLAGRGLRPPALIVADGAPGLWKAARELWPTAEEQRYTVHALRNVTGKLPERHHRDLKARWWQVFDDATSRADARRGVEAIVADYRTAYPSAMAVIERDLDALVAHQRRPSEHRKRIRSTNCSSAPSSRSADAPR
jgi:putative transposase